MTMEENRVIQHYNDLSGYISNWRMTMNLLYKKQIDFPKEVISYGDNCYDLSLMLSYLDDNLTRFENKHVTPQEFDYMAYAQARCFLKVCYLLIRVLFDNISGIIKYFYDNNEPKLGLRKSFNHLLHQAQSGKLPEDLSSLVKRTDIQFLKVKDRRDSIGHDYESLLISINRDEGGNTTLGHFGTSGRSSKNYEDIRQFFGNTLCEYQNLIDNLLDHFDVKFMQWYKFKPHRNNTILMGLSGNMLWWAYKYGNYTNKGLVVKETDIK
jgi:hypothetical protein